ncbi:FlaA1/EpsC-like NDP-sugar epimerase [Anseongella ginsenosidimutans]|uniref:FlaA1/EpsC-like NDP-sugar epimerase n=1 Tax=Anseongella ginsenosidimutans TaxID=496056 RepID=A0A4R3KLS9_9SPHI|nr:nucleoside-diphosphate sugar epimerase/dehydratase [Anseongella ginsenosidimutans]QEC54097.1 polysaccharide biosynthesis protein [Anseongella ginsenosidimutans]TCS85132.1 FlaA1/EpsC-like NDP-sugar epimerase [Anseongella ginsenosidimutans]
MLKKLRTTPRWIIFVIDVSLCAASVLLSFLLRFNFNLTDIRPEWFSSAIQVILPVNIVLFLLFRTYAGIVRYTGIQDAIRILRVTTLATILLFVANGIYAYNKLDGNLIPYSIIVIHFLCSSLLLISYRTLIKQVFDYFQHQNITKRKALIFGAGRSGLISKRVINNDDRLGLKVVGFLDDDPVKAQKKMDGLPILSTRFDRLERIIEKHKIEQIIISSQKISPERKVEFVDWCLSHNLKVLVVPPPEQWINGRLKTAQIRDVKIEELLEREAIVIHNESIENQLKDQCLLVTGAAGSIGSEIVRQVARYKPKRIVLCDQAETPLNSLELELREEFRQVNFESFVADVRDKNRLTCLFEKFRPQFVYHAAAYKHVPIMEHHPSEAILTNVLGTKNVADLAVQYGLEKFVMISTDKAVNPTNVMGASKRIAEIYIQGLNKYAGEHSFNAGLNKELSNGIDKKVLIDPIISTRFITTRFGNVLGSNGSVIPLFKAQLEKGGPLTVTHPEITRYFMTIPEACQLVLEAGSMGNGGEIFVFDMGDSVKIVDLAKKMIRLAGFTPDKDIKIEFTGLRPGEKLYEELLNNKENSLPTYNEKIMIATVREYDFETISKQIDSLIAAAANQGPEKAVVAKMKKILPEFISNNSVYEQLDKEFDLIP